MLYLPHVVSTDKNEIENIKIFQLFLYVHFHCSKKLIFTQSSLISQVAGWIYREKNKWFGWLARYTYIFF